MDSSHEYFVSGLQKEKIIFIVAVISISISSLLTKLLNFLSSIFTVPATFAISSATVFGLSYFLFSRVLWKNKWFCKFFRYPNLNGNFLIEGVSLKNPTGNEMNWNGTLGIEQTWDKILITLVTGTSSSHSLSTMCKVAYIAGIGYEVSYNYHNTPFMSEKDLNAHRGSCKITFNPEITEGKAEYYNNGKERESRGMMNIRRV